MFAVWTLVGAVVLALILKYLQRKKYNLPPGPWGLPFFGNIFQLDDEKPHITITKWCEEYGDVFRMTLCGRRVVVLNSYDTIYHGLVTKANDFGGRVSSFRNDIFLSHCPNVADQTFSPQWLFRKKVTLQTLKMHGDNLKNLEAISMDHIGDMLEDLELATTKGPIDIYPIYHRCITGVLTSVLYGKKLNRETVTTIRKILDDSFVLIQPTGINTLLDFFPWLRHFPNDLYRKLSAAAAEAKKVISKEIAERRTELEPGHPACFNDGILDRQRMCAENKTEMSISDDEIYGINVDLLLVGIFTTTITTNALIAVLINNPEIQQKMADNIKAVLGERPPTLADRESLHYIEATILEILRYSSIVTLNVSHYTMVDTTVNGYDIPKDTEVLFNLWKLHHNPDYWDEPWQFKPERYLNKDGTLVSADHINRKRLLPFGASRRVCVGEILARNRLFLIVTSLLQHFEFLPAGPNEIPNHDPRNYRPSFGIEPHNYRLRIVSRV